MYRRWYWEVAFPRRKKEALSKAHEDGIRTGQVMKLSSMNTLATEHNQKKNQAAHRKGQEQNLFFALLFTGEVSSQASKVYLVA